MSSLGWDNSVQYFDTVLEDSINQSVKTCSNMLNLSICVYVPSVLFAFIALTLMVWHQEEQPACKI